MSLWGQLRCFCLVDFFGRPKKACAHAQLVHGQGQGGCERVEPAIFTTSCNSHFCYCPTITRCAAPSARKAGGGAVRRRPLRGLPRGIARSSLHVHLCNTHAMYDVSYTCMRNFLHHNITHRTSRHHVACYARYIATETTVSLVSLANDARR